LNGFGGSKTPLAGRTGPRVDGAVRFRYPAVERIVRVTIEKLEALGYTQ
jgi:hypothetical protein